MSKSVIICEKPSVGKDVSRVLNCKMIGSNHAENNKYIVTWAFGHLVTLKTFEAYKENVNDISGLPLIPKHFKLEVIPQTKGQFFHIRKLLERKDVNEVIIATDAGREGELVARWILEFSNCKKPVKRLWISSVTDKAIKDGFNNLKPGDAYKQLFYAARARAKADWILGLNGTKALMLKYNDSLSMGRVQTPAVQLVLDREAEIGSFKSKSFYTLSIKLESKDNPILGEISFQLQLKEGKNRLFGETYANEIYEAIKGKKALISDIKKKERKAYPPKLYDLTTLQREANNRYNMSAKETLNAMQGLYERHKVLTYPRTDSNYISKDIVPTLSDRVKVCRHEPYRAAVRTILSQPIKGHGGYVNDNKVSDHHGIIPTEEMAFTENFSNSENKIYHMVVQRFLGVLLPPARYEDYTLECKIGDYTFLGKKSICIEAGYEALYNKEESQSGDDKDGQSLQGNKLIQKEFSLDRILKEEGKTQPPKYLSEGDLLHEMEKRNLGTVATRADIIEKIQSNNYIEMVQNVFRTTKTGRQLLDLVPDIVRSADLTAKWEKQLADIEKGRLHEQEFLKQISQKTREIVQDIRNSENNYRPANLTSEKCPECSSPLLRKENKFGKRLVCTNGNCKYTKQIEKATNARCPECKKKMNLVGDKNKESFVCRCGFKESMDHFNKRKKERGNSMSKREVQRYLDKQTKDEPINNPFADLLKDLKS